MKARASSRPRGGILIFVLMLSAVCVLGLTGWITTISAKSKYVDALELAAQRRIAEQNGRRLAAKYASVAVMDLTTTTAFSAGVGGYIDGVANWGGISVQPWAGNTLNSTAPAAGVNRLSLGDRGAYGFSNTPPAPELALAVTGPDLTVPYRLQPKSYPSFLAGDLLMVHRLSDGTSPTITGQIEIVGRAYFHTMPNLTFGTIVAGSHAYAPEITVPGAAITDKNTNFPSQPTRAWATASGANRVGFSNVVWDSSWNASYPNDPANQTLRNKVFEGHDMFPNEYIMDGAVKDEGTKNIAYASTGPNSSGAPDQQYRVTIDLNKPQCGTVVVENARYIEFIGQNTGDPAPSEDWQTVLVVIRANDTGSQQLQRIEFKYHNQRRLVVGLSSKDPVDVNASFTGFADNQNREWRLALFAENTPMVFNLDTPSPGISSVTLQGGLSIDHNLTVLPATAFNKLILTRETDRDEMVQRLPRRLWAEVLRSE